MTSSKMLVKFYFFRIFPPSSIYLNALKNGCYKLAVTPGMAHSLNLHSITFKTPIL